MAAFKLPQRRTSQPQQPVGIDWSNPITRGLAFADSGRDAQPGTEVTGARAAMLRDSIGRGYGSGAGGSGGADILQTSVRHHAPQRTWFWISSHGSHYASGEGGGFRVITTKNAGSGFSEFIGINGDIIVFQRWHDTQVGEWYFDYQLGNSIVPDVLALTYDSTSNANNAVMWQNGVQRAHTGGVVPIGTPVDNADHVTIGNRPTDFFRVNEGRIGFFYIFDRILTDGEIKSLTDNPWQIFAPINRALPLSSGVVPPATTDREGVFDVNAVPQGWFDTNAQAEGWFDRDLLDVVAGGGGVSGTATTSQAQTSDAAGTHTPAAVSGTAASSQAQTSAAAGAHVPVAVTGTAASSQAQTSAATGSTAPATVTGTATSSQAQTSSAAGTHAPAAVSATGASSQAQTSAAAGTHTPAAVSGTATSSQAQTSAASGAFSTGVSGTATSSQAQTSAAAGTHAPAAVTATGTASQAQTSDAVGAHTIAAVTGPAASSQAQTSAASGAFSTGVSGAATSSQAQTSAAAGTHAPAAVTATGASSQTQTSDAAGAHAPAAVTGTATSSQAQSSAAAGEFLATGNVVGAGATAQAQTSAAAGAQTFSAITGTATSSQAQTTLALLPSVPSDGGGGYAFKQPKAKPPLRKPARVAGAAHTAQRQGSQAVGQCTPPSAIQAAPVPASVHTHAQTAQPVDQELEDFMTMLLQMDLEEL